MSEFMGLFLMRVWAKLGFGLLLYLVAAGAVPGFAQSLGDVARKERERKASEALHRSRIFTNEDMERGKILEPEPPALLESTVPIPAEAHGPVKLSPEAPPAVDVRILRKAKLLPQQQKVKRAVVKIHARPSPASPPVSSASVAGSSSIPPQKLVRSTAERKASPPANRVRVRPGDSLWKLASRYLASGDQWRKIAALNPQLHDPNRVLPGQWLLLPPRQAAVAAAGKMRVGKGDSLWKVARLQLGSGQAWSCIARANPQIREVNVIYPGQLLTIPSSCGQGT